MGTFLSIRRARVNNLREVSLLLPPDQLIVFSGVSGSGKSSMAFETIYAYGQNAYIDSLGSHPKMPMLARPEVESVDGVSPTIAIEQKSAGKNPRSTVATMTQIHDFLRLLYARVGVPHCPMSQEAVQPRSLEQILKAVAQLEAGEWTLLAIVAKGVRAEFSATFRDFLRQGFRKARLDGHWISLEEPPVVTREHVHTLELVVDQLHLGKVSTERLSEAVSQALEMGHGTFLAVSGEKERFFSMHAFSPTSGCSYPPLEPHNFSFNHPAGMCEMCHGLGEVDQFDASRLLQPELSLQEGACRLSAFLHNKREQKEWLNALKIPLDKPWKALKESDQQFYLAHLFEAAHERLLYCDRAQKQTLSAWMTRQQCPKCHGGRLRSYPLATRFSGKRIDQVMALSLEDCRAFFETVQLSKEERVIAETLLQQIRQRLSFLIDVGLAYLTLDRTAPTLSGGEAQRVRLACQLGAGLVGATYVLDEPSIGLHPVDNQRLLQALRHLTDLGNRVIIVEHDEETILSADQVVDFGPLAGKDGGNVVFQGEPAKFLKSKGSLTADYLTGKKKVWDKPPRLIKGEWLSLKGATHHNLRGQELRLPLGAFIAITGPSGSGKSSLLSETLYPALANRLNGAELPEGHFSSLEGFETLDKVIAIDQSPLGRMSRSNPATYTKVFDSIRDLFAELPESRARGFDKSRFSFNVKEGACARCKGIGQLPLALDTEEEGWICCPICEGRRFDSQTLSITYKGKNIAEVLQMTVDEAAHFFSAQPAISRILQVLQETGLGYMALGEPSVHLSGGEAQRVKLAKELARPHRRPCLYLLDEPTTGLHFHDIAKLLHALHSLVDQGHTVVVIEHNLDLIRSADWIIDLGPKGGKEGGSIVAQGTVAELKKSKSVTGEALSYRFKVEKKKARTIEPVTQIEIEGAKEHTLKDLSLTIPRGAITAITGPSGSGKSSLAFDTLYAEGQRRYSEALPPYIRQFIEKLPPPKVDRMSGLSPAIAIEQRTRANNPRSTVGTLTQVIDDLRVVYAQEGIAHSPESGEVIEWIGTEQIGAQVLAFPKGATLLVVFPLEKATLEAQLRHFQQKGFIRVYTEEKLLFIEEALERSLKKEIYLVIDRFPTPTEIDKRLLEAIESAKTLSQEEIIFIVNGKLHRFLFGFVDKAGKRYPALSPHLFSFNHKEGYCPACMGHGCGVCQETRLNAFARAVLWRGISIDRLAQLPLDEVLKICEGGSCSHPLVQEHLTRAVHRLRFACQIGLHYLSLERTAGTLSAGEAQRIRLARQLGSGLTGVLYVLDEPSIGLHPHEVHLLNQSLKELQALGNTVVVVEHDMQVIQEADRLIEMGPKAGRQGGEILFQGTIKEAKEENSLTGKELQGKLDRPYPTPRHQPTRYISLEDVKVRNLQNLSLQIPIGCLTCITGRSGSGKSTLMEEVLYKAAVSGLGEPVVKRSQFTVKGLQAIHQVILIDQAPIGASIRSDIATYTDVLAPVRQLFAELPAAKAAGLKGMHFSYNHPAGMCTHCWGLGYKIINMQFLPEVHLPCQECLGMRLRARSLQVTYRGYHMGQLLQMTVEQFAAFFAHLPKVQRQLKALHAVGLDYLQIGQNLLTLSGGEAQRLKLSQELSKRNRGETLYLFDEPTTGLHLGEVQQLIDILHALVDHGHTVVIIEHHKEVIRAADYVVDLGPGSGKDGGRLLFAGPPQELLNCRASVTARYLSLKP